MRADYLEDLEALYSCIEENDDTTELIKGELRNRTKVPGLHNKLSAHVATFLKNLFRKENYTSHKQCLLVRCDSHESICIPDVALTAADTQLTKHSSKFIEGAPILVCEVSTQYFKDSDLEKIAIYQAVPGIMHYLILKENRIQGTLYSRIDESKWLTHELTKGADPFILFVKYYLTLNDIYKSFCYF